jgi:predicted small lipoprotein YifL
MKKTFLIAVLIITLALIFAGCGAGKLPESFDETAVTDRAKEIVQLLTAQDFEAVSKEVREDVRELLPANELEKALGKMISDLGAFTEYKTVVTAGTKDQKTGEEYATVVLVCNYASGSATYTISMDKNLEIVGLYMK